MMNQADELLKALDVNYSESNMEIALEVINKYGSYKKAMQATIGIEFKKKESLLIALLGSEDEEDKSEFSDEARRLIQLVIGINQKVFDDSQSFGIQFSDLMKQIRLDKMIIDRELSILNSVKPYCDANRLISEINCFQDGNTQLQAFIDAIKITGNKTVQIANPLKNLRIKHG